MPTETENNTRCHLPRSFYDRPTLVVAEELLGKVLVHRSARGVAAGMIVEAEAYIGEDDPACHAAPGPTARNAPLYGPPGVAYVYLNYGVHCLMNAVTEGKGSPAAVLIRALQPLDGVALMKVRRGGHLGEIELCRGPGNLTKALGITRTFNGKTASRQSGLWIEDRGTVVLKKEIIRMPRIGVAYAGAWAKKPWRFVWRGPLW